MLHTIQINVPPWYEYETWVCVYCSRFTHFSSSVYAEIIAFIYAETVIKTVYCVITALFVSHAIVPAI